jgi:hypothetical protein
MVSSAGWCHQQDDVISRMVSSTVVQVGLIYRAFEARYKINFYQRLPARA